MLGAVLVIVYLGYRTLGAFTLEYWVDRDGVTVMWGATRQIVPMGQIERIVPGPQCRTADGHAPVALALPAPPAHGRPMRSGRSTRTAPGRSPSRSSSSRRAKATAFRPPTPALPSMLCRSASRSAQTARWNRSSNGRRSGRGRSGATVPRLFLMGAGLLGVLLMFGALCVSLSRPLIRPAASLRRDRPAGPDFSQVRAVQPADDRACCRGFSTPASASGFTGTCSGARPIFCGSARWRCKASQDWRSSTSCVGKQTDIE